ncbi:hypothetical protein M8494_23575 [Serratia ureilytica]
MLSGLDAILIPGGFGYRGVEGKVMTARCAREQHSYLAFAWACRWR